MAILGNGMYEHCIVMWSKYCTCQLKFFSAAGKYTPSCIIAKYPSDPSPESEFFKKSPLLRDFLPPPPPSKSAWFDIGL